MKVLELFAGTASFSNVATKRGHVTFTTDNNPDFNSSLTDDVMELGKLSFPFDFEIVWASPPCETFSVASIGHHWAGGFQGYEPKTEAAARGIERVLKTLELIDELKPKAWIIENPRGLLRKMPFMNKEGIYRYTVTYCQYGDTRMKPTDLWSNIPNLVFKPMCKNGDSCHVAAPRGSSTGTQGIKTHKDRSRVPNELCESILMQLEARLTNTTI